jgi:hypothetical protein
MPKMVDVSYALIKLNKGLVTDSSFEVANNFGDSDSYSVVFSNTIIKLMRMF